MTIENKIIEKYIKLAYGLSDITNDNLSNLKVVICYLLDNGYTDKDVLKYLIVYEVCLDDVLWSNSLLLKDTIYYHDQLTIMPSAPIWSPTKKEKSVKFFLEMKINYTIENLLEYYYKELSIPIELRNYKRDKNAFEHMLKKYNNRFKVQAIDFILYLIDYNASEKAKVSNVFDLEKYELDTFNKVNFLIENSKRNIVWRGLTI